MSTAMLCLWGTVGVVSITAIYFVFVRSKQAPAEQQHPAPKAK